MLPSPAYREMWIPENADEGSRVFVPLPGELSTPRQECEEPGGEPYEDALDFAVRIEDVKPTWHCDSCSTLNGHLEFACGYCGSVREDV